MELCKQGNFGYQFQKFRKVDIDAISSGKNTESDDFPLADPEPPRSGMHFWMEALKALWLGIFKALNFQTYDNP